jgi:hypothetical protein
MTTTGHRQTPTPRKRWRINWQAVVGVLLVAAAAYTAGETYHQGEASQQRADCQTALNRDFLTSLQARDRAAREESNAQRDLLATPSVASTDTKAAARERYLKALADLDAARAANPLPGGTTC